MTTKPISTAIFAARNAGARSSAARGLALLGTALGSTLVVFTPAHAQNISSTNNTTDYRLTETGTRSGGPRTVDVATSGGDIILDLGTVNVDNTAANNPNNVAGVAIGTNNTGPGATSVRVANITGTGANASNGIDARATTGAITIVNGGTIDMSGNNGDRAIVARSGGGDVAITSNIANGQQYGIIVTGNGNFPGSTFGDTGTTTINSTTATANGTGLVNAIVGQGYRVVINSGTATNANTAGNSGTAIFANAGAGGVLLNAGTTTALGTNQAGMQIFSDATVDVTSGIVRTTQNSDGISIASGSAVVVRSTSVTNSGTNSGYGIVLGANRGGGGFNSGVDGFAYTSAAVTSGTVSTAGANAYGIYATPNGAGTTAITSGSVTTTGAGATGIVVGTIGAGTSSGAITIASDTINASGATSGGIQIANTTGAVSITSNRISSTTTGISAVGGDVTINSGSIAVASTASGANSGNGMGINAVSTGTGSTALKVTSGSIVFTGPGNTSGITAQNVAAGGTLDITSGTVTTTGNGGYGIIGASNSAAITINSTGPITTVGTTRSVAGSTAPQDQRYADGIDAISSAGSIAVTNSGTISTAGTTARGIDAEQGRAITTFGTASTVASTAALSVTNTGTIKTAGTNANAINVQNDSGAATIASTAISTTGLNALGISASSLAGALSITSANLTTTGAGATGISVAPLANTVLTGAVTINSTGALQTGAASGIATNNTSGAVTVNNTGAITTGGDGSRGIAVQTFAGNVAIASNAITTTGANAFGITVQPLGQNATVGTIAVANTGALSTSGASAIGINLFGGTSAIDVVNTGSVTTTGTNAFGVSINSTGASSLSGTGTINSTGVGVLVFNNARITGPVSIATGAITTSGANASGIQVTNVDGAVTIAPAAITTTGANTQGITALGLGGSAAVNASALNTTGTAITLSQAANATGGVTVQAGTIRSGSFGVSVNATGAAGAAVTVADTVAVNGAVSATGAGPIAVTSGVAQVTGATATGLVANSTANKATVTSTTLTTVGRGIFAQGLNDAAVTSGTITNNSNNVALVAQTVTNPQTGGAAGVVRVDSTTINSGGAGIAAFGPRADVIVNSGSVVAAGTSNTGIGANGVNSTLNSGSVAMTDGFGINASFANGATLRGTSRVVSGTVTLNGTDTTTTGAITANNAAVDITSDTITTTGTGNRFGISALGTVANAAGQTTPDFVTITSNKISTVGDGAYGINAGTQTGLLTVNSTGTITTVGATRMAGNQFRYSAGIIGTSVSGNIAVTSNAIATSGAESDGVRIEANSGQVTFQTGLASVAGTIGVTSTGPITTGGDNAAGIRVLAGGSATTLNLTGAIRTTGANAYGVFAQSGTGAIAGNFGNIATTGAGADAVRLLSDSGAITANVNGTLSSAGGVGLFIDPPSTVALNVAAGASVTGLTGVNVTGSANTLTNLGTIAGTNGAGIVATGATVLSNSGTLSGTGGTAVQLGAANDSVTLRTGSVVTGRVVGGGGTDAAFVSGTGTVATASQTIAGFDGFDTLTVQNGYWTALAGNGSAFATSITTNANSTLEVANGATGVAVTAPTLIDNGALVVRSSAASAGSTFGAGTITGGGTVLFTGAGTAALTGTNTIASTGTVTVDGGSTVLITGTQGGTFALTNAGTLQVGNGGTTGAFTGSLLDSGTLIVNRSDDYAFTGAVSGTGNIVKQGAGKLTFGTNFAFTGVTTIQAGSIKLSTPVAANTELDLEGSGQLDLSGTTQRIAELAGASPTASLNIAGGSLTDVQSTNTTFAGSIVGNGTLDKSGPGRLNLTGTNTYTGPTTVSGGTLAVNGSIVSPVTVAANGTLGGTGTVGTVVIGANGTYAPGNSIGTQTVNGNVTFAAGSTFAVEANAAGQADRVNATGTATLQGGTVAVTPTAGNYANLTNYTILTATGGVTGAFASTTSADATLTPFLTYGANAVTLTLARNNVAFGAMGGSPNQIAVGAAISQLGVNSGIYRALLPLSASAMSAPLANLSGELYASLPATLADNSKQVREAVLARASTPGDGVGLWATGTRTLAGSRNQAGVAPVIDNRWTAIGGVDFSLSGLRIGVDGGYIEDETRVRQQGARAHTETKLVGGHVGYDRGPVSVIIGGDYAWHDITASRTLGIAGLAGGTNADTKAHSVQGYGEIGYGVSTGALNVVPFARFSYVHIVSDAFTETGGLGALTAARDERNYKFGSLGVRMSGEAPVSGSVTFLPRATIAYTRGWDIRGSRTLAFAGTTPQFLVTGTALARDALDVNAGFDLDFGHRLTLGAGGFGSTSREWSDYGAKASIGLKF